MCKRVHCCLEAKEKIMSMIRICVWLITAITWNFKSLKPVSREISNHWPLLSHDISRDSPFCVLWVQTTQPKMLHSRYQPRTCQVMWQLTTCSIVTNSHDKWSFHWWCKCDSIWLSINHIWTFKQWKVKVAICILDWTFEND